MIIENGVVAKALTYLENQTPQKPFRYRMLYGLQDICRHLIFLLILLSKRQDCCRSLEFWKLDRFLALDGNLATMNHWFITRKISLFFHFQWLGNFFLPFRASQVVQPFDRSFYCFSHWQCFFSWTRLSLCSRPLVVNSRLKCYQPLSLTFKVGKMVEIRC